MRTFEVIALTAVCALAAQCAIAAAPVSSSANSTARQKASVTKSTSWRPKTFDCRLLGKADVRRTWGRLAEGVPELSAHWWSDTGRCALAQNRSTSGAVVHVGYLMSSASEEDAG